MQTVSCGGERAFIDKWILKWEEAETCIITVSEEVTR